jgi:hypothetical protein
MGEQLRVSVLGGLDVAVGGLPLVGLASAKARALLAYLAVTGAAHSRSALAGLLWSDLPEETARTNLRLVLTKLRRALYLNLHGATPGLAPLDPLEALGRLLRALGLDSSQVPADVEEAAARFRSLAAERRLLVLLDNARDAEQVRPLLPASPASAVLITSRQALTTLEGVRAVHLDVLAQEQALELLGRIAGQDRVAADPRSAAEVVCCCGRLPLAIRIAGARLASRPGWPMRVLAERVADATHRLEELATGELAVRASFDVSLRTLERSPDPVDRAAAAAFGLLSLPNGPDLGLAAAARLLDEPEPYPDPAGAAGRRAPAGDPSAGPLPIP